MDTRSLTGLLLVALVVAPLGTAVATPANSTHNNSTPEGPTRAFIADDRDPRTGTIPPFLFTSIADVLSAEGISLGNISQMRDFSYATTQPPYRVGPDQQTLGEYQRGQLQSIHRNESTSLWLRDSNRSNGTVVKDAHITILGAQEGAQTRLGNTSQNRSTNESDRLLIPRNGSVSTHLDYSTPLPNQTCTVAGDTKTCHSYSLLDQEVDRELQIGAQNWSGDEESPRQIEYRGANASEPTTMQVRATINSTVAIEAKTYARNGGSWELSNTTSNETLSLSHTVQDRTRAVVTTNQNLSVTQTIVRSEGQPDRIILQFEGPQSLSDRRLWSHAKFKESDRRLRNVWGVYSQRQYQNATRGHRLAPETNVTVSGPTNNTTRLNQTLAAQLAATKARQHTVPFPNVLERRLAAVSRQPSIQGAQNTSVGAVPEITRFDGFQLADSAAPLGQHVNLTSLPPRGTSTIIISNADQPITDVRDIHNDSISLETRTARERNTTLSTTVLNETHARIQLTATTGEPLAGRSVWLSGASQGHVTTHTDGSAVVERRDLYVTASFSGATNASRHVYYGPAQTQIAFQPEPFNIYEMLTSLAGAVVSVVAFLIFFLPFAYFRERKNG